MKTLIRFKTLALILILSACFYSCDKDELETGKNITQEAEFSAETELLKDAVEIEGEVIFSVNYNESLTKEEASAQFDKDLQQFLKKNPQTPKKSLSTEWFYQTGFYTGSQTGNTSSGQVQSRVYFKTNRGTSWVGKNYPKGYAKSPGWKMNYSRGWYPNHLPVAFVKPTGHRVSLRGTDALFVRHMSVNIHAGNQSIRARGNAGLWHSPYKWLKGNSSNSWDHYYSAQWQSGENVTFY